MGENRTWKNFGLSITVWGIFAGLHLLWYISYVVWILTVPHDPYIITPFHYVIIWVENTIPILSLILIAIFLIIMRTLPTLHPTKRTKFTKLCIIALCFQIPVIIIRFFERSIVEWLLARSSLALDLYAAILHVFFLVINVLFYIIWVALQKEEIFQQGDKNRGVNLSIRLILIGFACAIGMDLTMMLYAIIPFYVPYITWNFLSTMSVRFLNASGIIVIFLQAFSLVFLIIGQIKLGLELNRKEGLSLEPSAPDESKSVREGK